MATISVFCCLLYFVLQSHLTEAATIKYPMIAKMKWDYECRNLFLFDSYCHKVESYTLVQLSAASLSIINPDNGGCENSNVCKSWHSNIIATLIELEHEVIPTNFFYYFICTGTLKINPHLIIKLAQNDFHNAGKLVVLDISYNRLNEILSRTFSKANNLNTIDLSHNFISHIDDDAFDGLSNLNYLYLHNNSLLSISPTIFKPSLTLTLENNLLESVQCDSCEQTIHSISVANNNNLTTFPRLNAQRLLMSNIPIKVLSFSTITTFIRAENCDIESVVIPNANILQELLISSNRLKIVDNFVFLKSLTKLDISHNFIETINGDFLSNLPQLERLDISHNKMITFDQNISPQPIVVKNLNVGHNYLKSFVLQGNYTNLKKLKIDGNNITSISTNIRKQAPLLELLDLNDNNFTCSQLTLTLLLLKYDGISLVTPDQTVERSKNWHYVKGIRCWNPKNDNFGIQVTRSETSEASVAGDDLNTDSQQMTKEHLLSKMNEAIKQMETNFENKFIMLKKKIAYIPSENTINQE